MAYKHRENITRTEQSRPAVQADGDMRQALLIAGKELKRADTELMANNYRVEDNSTRWHIRNALKLIEQVLSQIQQQEKK